MNIPKGYRFTREELLEKCKEVIIDPFENTASAVELAYFCKEQLASPPAPQEAAKHCAHRDPLADGFCPDCEEFTPLAKASQQPAPTASVVELAQMIAKLDGHISLHEIFKDDWEAIADKARSIIAGHKLCECGRIMKDCLRAGCRKI